MSSTVAPATAAQDITYSNGFYMVSTLSGGGGYVTLYTLDGTATNINSTCCSPVDINTPQTYSPNGVAIEPDNITLANFKAGCRIESAAFLNGTVLFVYTGDYNTGGYDYNSIYFNQLNVANQTLSQNWSFLGGSNYDYPSVASFGISQSDLAVIIAFCKTDTITNPEIRFKYFDNNMNQLASTQVRAGDSYVDYAGFNSQRWGDYTTTQRRYNTSLPEVWLSGSFGNTSHYWQTNISQVTGYPGSVGITEVNLDEKQLSEYPNPVTSQLYVKGNFSSYYGFPELYSVDGKLMKIDVTRKGNEMFQIDVASLASGQYILKFKDLPSVKFIKE